MLDVDAIAAKILDLVREVDALTERLEHLDHIAKAIDDLGEADGSERAERLAAQARAAALGDHGPECATCRTAIDYLAASVGGAVAARDALLVRLRR